MRNHVSRQWIVSIMLPVVLILAGLCVLAFLHHRIKGMGAVIGHNSSLDVPVPQGPYISSIAWSPDGKYIAYTTMIGTGDRFSGATLWVAASDSLSSSHQTKRVAEMRLHSGPPGTLFWISPSEIAWPQEIIVPEQDDAVSSNEIGWPQEITAPGQDNADLPSEIGWPQVETVMPGQGNGFAFYVADVQSGSIKELGRRRFKVFHIGGNWWHGPDDVYWDSKRRLIAFSAQGDKNGHGDGYARIWVYDPWRNKARIIEALPPSLMSDCGSQLVVQFSGLYDSRSKPFLVTCGRHGDYGVWMTGGKAQPQNGFICVERNTDGLYFPRLSPDGRKAAWVGMYDKRNKDVEWDKRMYRCQDRHTIPPHTEARLIVKDLKTGQRRMICKWPDYHFSSIGCPYSWSPDGKAIAYPEGKQIRIVRL